MCVIDSGFSLSFSGIARAPVSRYCDVLNFGTVKGSARGRMMHEDDERLLQDLRGHLTVAMMAAQHLHRLHPNAVPVAHLFAHLHAAHQQLLADIKQAEAILARVHDSHR